MGATERGDHGGQRRADNRRVERGQEDRELDGDDDGPNATTRAHGQTIGQRERGSATPVRARSCSPISWTRANRRSSSTKDWRWASTTMRPSTITVWTLCPSAL